MVGVKWVEVCSATGTSLLHLGMKEKIHTLYVNLVCGLRANGCNHSAESASSPRGNRQGLASGFLAACSNDGRESKIFPTNEDYNNLKPFNTKYS